LPFAFPKDSFPSEMEKYIRPVAPIISA